MRDDNEILRECGVEMEDKECYLKTTIFLYFALLID